MTPLSGHMPRSLLLFLLTTGAALAAPVPDLEVLFLDAKMWSKPVGEIYNMIRGSDPSPGAGTTFGGSKIQFFRTQRRDGDTGKEAGEVVHVNGTGFEIAANGGAIFVGRVQPEGSRKIAASEWIESVGLKAGDKFGVEEATEEE